jgi:hypothetical protein
MKDQGTNNPVTPSDPLIGAWELVSGSYVGDDNVVVDYQKAAVKSLKILTNGKYCFVTTTEGSFYAAGGGDYIAENGQYIEIPSIASHTDMIGKRFEFQYQIENDIWTNSRWQNGIRVEYEVWKRVR